VRSTLSLIRIRRLGGNYFDSSRANTCDVNCFLPQAVAAHNDGYARTAPVGTFSGGASPYGIVDMVGNVWEWTAESVIRGGGWSKYDHQSRTTAERGKRIDTSYANYDIGFRCVKDS
jgi:formylglycine-generating enzyme required for sulfatase activity